MDKQEIINKLKDFPYSRDEYWVITGSAMVLYGIREQTHDIDMGCTTVMADQLVADGYSYQLTESGNRKFNYGFKEYGINPRAFKLKDGKALCDSLCNE